MPSMTTWLPIAEVVMPLIFAESLFVVLWSTGFIVAEIALRDAGPFTILLWRYGMTGIVLVAWATVSGAFRRISGSAFRVAIATGLLAHLLWLGSLYWAQYLGISPGHAALIAALQPMLTSVLSGRVVGEPVSRQQWLGLGIGFGGVLLVIGQPGAHTASLAAYALAFVPPLALTAAVLLERWQALRMPADAPRPPTAATMATQFAVTALAAWPLAMLLEGMQTQWTVSFVVSLLWLGPALSFGSYALLWYLVANTDATRASSLFYFTPPVAMLMAWLLFGQGLSYLDLGGLLLAGAGVVMVRMRAAPTAKRAPSLRVSR